MNHLSDIELIELAAGHLAAPQSRECEAHLLACADCRARYEESAGVWDQLGTWELTLPQVDLSERVVRAIDESHRLRMPRRLQFPWRAARIAASIAVAMGIGHLAGRMTWDRSPQPVARVADDQAAAALYLEEIGHVTAADLTDLLLVGPDSTDMEDQR